MHSTCNGSILFTKFVYGLLKIIMVARPMLLSQILLLKWRKLRGCFWSLDSYRREKLFISRLGRATGGYPMKLH